MTNDRLEKLMERREAVNARIRREQAKARALDRKDDTRRKILAGAAVIDRAEKDATSKADLDQLLAKFLVRPDDRALFGLPPLASDVVNIASGEAVPNDDAAGDRDAA